MAQDIADIAIDEELLEFLEADLLPEAAHPLFKKQLRDYLLAILRAEGKLKAAPIDASPERDSSRDPNLDPNLDPNRDSNRDPNRSRD